MFVQKKRLKGAKYREAAEARSGNEEQSEAMDVDDGPETYPPPSKMVVEVVIPVYKSQKKSIAAASSSYSSAVEATPPPSSEPTSAAESSDVEDAKPRLRQRAGRVSIIESDDDEVVEVTPKGKGKAPVTKPKFKKPIKRKAESSDYEDSFAETDEDDEDEDGNFEEFEVSDSESGKKALKKSKPVKPSRPSKKAKTSGKSKADKEADSGKKTKKSAAAKPSKPAKLREETDPWKLKSKAKKDWKQMHAPPLEMFYFARLVIDEYTYLEGKILSMVQKLTATRRWVLSGTPPIHDFAALKTISAFLDIHLGIDDDGEGQSALVKKRQREQTGTAIDPIVVSCH